MSRHTTPPRRHSRQSVLEVRVFSPRIVWFECRRWVVRLAKIACLLGICAGIAWAGWRGIQQAFLKNPDFRLQIITLNPNPVIDELGVAAAAGINLASSPSLFDIDVQNVCQKLKNLPAIADAHVERHLPGTLAVSVVPRTPVAWISCPGAGLTESRHAGALLVDHAGIAYPCPERQVESCATLPIIELPPVADSPLKAGNKIRQPELEHCCLLLEAARTADPDAMQWIESVKQVNEWSLLLVTRQGTAATFGLGDHARQMESLRAALDHAVEKSYLINTINLIPKYNIPITLRAEPVKPHVEPTPPRTEPTTPHAEPSPSHAEATKPHAETTKSRAESSKPRAEPASARAEPVKPRTTSAQPRAITVKPRTTSTPARAITVKPRTTSTPPRAIPVPPRAIPLTAQDSIRSRVAGSQRN